MFDVDPYAPTNILKPVADNVWIVDGPVIRMAYLWTTFPFPTRMTVVRLADGGLWVHSPTELAAPLKSEIDALGPVRFLVAPNRIHYWWLGDWQVGYPQARTYAPPKVEANARSRGARIDHVLGETTVSEWNGEIAHVVVPGSFMDEAEFFHPASRTLILTDLIENFEEKKISEPLWTFLCRVGGVLDPHGSTPRDLRTTFFGHKAAVRKSVETMIAWQPSRIIIAHGRWYPDKGEAELRRALGWTGVR